MCAQPHTLSHTPTCKAAFDALRACAISFLAAAPARALSPSKSTAGLEAYPLDFPHLDLLVCLILRRHGCCCCCCFLCLGAPLDERQVPYGLGSLCQHLLSEKLVQQALIIRVLGHGQNLSPLSLGGRSGRDQFGGAFLSPTKIKPWLKELFVNDCGFKTQSLSIEGFTFCECRPKKRACALCECRFAAAALLLLAPQQKRLSYL